MKAKRFIFIIMAVFIASFCFFVLITAAAGENVVIKSIIVKVDIQTDGIVRIEENIEADFSFSPGHGIYRDLPYVYRDKSGKKLYTEIEILGVYDADSLSHKYSVNKNNSNLRIKIGNPDVLVSGVQKYQIVYTVKGAILSFDDYDEFYWNVIGTEWTSSISFSSAEVTLPEDSIIQTTCYSGEYGSSTSCDTSQVSDRTAYFNSKNIPAGGAFTVAVGFKKGLVPVLSVAAPIIGMSRFNFAVFVLTIIIGTIVITKIWWTKGRDIWWRRKSLFDPAAREETMPVGAHETIVVEYDPPAGLRPAEMSLVKNESVNVLDISATIVDLAVRGYLKIKEIPKKWILSSNDYELIKSKDTDEALLEYEKYILDSLFEFGKSTGTVKLSELKEKYYKKLKRVKKLVYKSVIDKKIFTVDPEKARNKVLIYSIIGFIGSILILTTGILPGLGWGTLIVMIIFTVFLLPAIPQRTAYGRDIYRQIKGYKLFISGTEKYRQPFFENQNIFMEVLPYAIIFGLTKKLADAMHEMGIEPQAPVWFVGTSGNFNIDNFSSSIDGISKSLSSAVASAPGGSGSGGGGFSGGGGGGGGGGGW